MFGIARTTFAPGRDDWIFLIEIAAIKEITSFPSTRSAISSKTPFASAALTARMITLASRAASLRSEEHTSELQSRFDLVCRLLLEKKKQYTYSPLYINRPRITIPRICSISRSLPLPSSQDCDGRLYQFQNLRSDVYWTTALISRSE